MFFGGNRVLCSVLLVATMSFVVAINSVIYTKHTKHCTPCGYEGTNYQCLWTGPKTYATISGALAYDTPQTGKVYHLVINQAIHIPHLDHHLLCPMQC